MTTTNTKNSIVLTRGITNTDSPSCVSQETIEKLAKNVLTNMSNKELEKEEREVLCKMVVKGKASNLRNIVDQVFSTYYNNNRGFDKDLVVTLMIEKGDEEEDVKKY